MKNFKLVTTRFAKNSKDFEKKERIQYECFCDGSFDKTTGSMGIGAYIKDADCIKDEVMNSRVLEEKYHKSGSAFAEFWGIQEVILLAIKNNIKDLRVHSDNRGIIRALNGKPSVNEDFKKELEVIHKIIKDQEINVQFDWIPRVENALADSMAKKMAFELAETILKDSTIKNDSTKTTKDIDIEWLEEIEKKHLGLKRIQKKHLLAGRAQKSLKEEACWREGVKVRVWTEHGENDDIIVRMQCRGKRVKFKGAVWMDDRSTMALMEIKMILRAMKWAAAEGNKHLVIETNNQNVALMCSGVKKPPSNLKSAIFTLYKKAELFDGVLFKHKNFVPLLKKEKLELSRGRCMPVKKGFNTDVIPIIQSKIINIDNHYRIVTELKLGEEVSKDEADWKMQKGFGHTPKLFEIQIIAKMIRYLEEMGFDECIIKNSNFANIHEAEKNLDGEDFLIASEIQAIKKQVHINIKFEQDSLEKKKSQIIR